jgi:hypothetical protein
MGKPLAGAAAARARSVCACTLLVLLAAPAAHAAPLAFDNDCGTNNWHSTCGGQTNWDNDGLPGIGDDVTISAGPVSAGPSGGPIIRVKTLQAPGGLKLGNVDLSLQGASAVTGLEWFDGFIASVATGAAPALLLSGASVWGTNGSLQGLGGIGADASITRVRNDGTLNVVGVGIVDGVRFDNFGEVVLRARLDLHPNALVVNGGTWALNNGVVQKADVFGDPDTAMLDNLGTLRNVGGSSTVAVKFDSTSQSAIESQNGMLTFSREATFAGPMTVAAGAKLVLQAVAATQRFETVKLAGEGQVELAGGPMQRHRVTGELANEMTAPAGHLFLRNANVEIDAGAALANRALLRWGTPSLPAGAVRGAGTFRNEAPATVQIDSAAGLGAVLANLGTVVQTANLTVDPEAAFADDVAVRNEAAGRWEIRNAEILSGGAGLTRRIRNLGTFTASQVARVLPAFDSAGDGTFAVPEGATVQLRGGGVWSSPRPLAISGIADLDGPSLVLPQTYTVTHADAEIHPVTTFAAAGTLDVRPGAILRIEGSLRNRVVANLRNGAITGPGTFVNSLTLRADSGRLGSAAGGRLALSNLGDMVVLGEVRLDGTLENRGAAFARLSIVNLAALVLEQGSRVVNQEAGVLRLEGAAAVNGEGEIANAGRLEKWQGGTAVVRVRLDNDGEVVSTEGTLDLAGPVAQVEGNRLTGGTWVLLRGNLIIRGAVITALGAGAHVAIGRPAAGSAFEHLRRVEGMLNVVENVEWAEDIEAAGAGVVRVRDGATMRAKQVRVGPDAKAATEAGGGGGGGGVAPPAPHVDLDGGPFVNEGAVLPGDEGAVTAFVVDGTYTQTASGRLRLDVSATAHDALHVTGTAALAGQLEVSLLDGHLPRPEDELVVVAAAAVSGRFANAGERPQLTQGAFAVRYEADRVVLSDFDADAVASVTPTPSTTSTPAPPTPTPGGGSTSPSGSPAPTPTATPLPADVDGNGIADAADLDHIIAAIFAPSFAPRADLNRDAAVTTADVTAWLGL